LIAGWLTAAAFACFVSLAFLVRDGGTARHPDETGRAIYSRSALGYAALYHTLKQLGVPVADSTTHRPPGSRPLSFAGRTRGCAGMESALRRAAPRPRTAAAGGGVAQA
jgi:hypothetical protein